MRRRSAFALGAAIATVAVGIGACSDGEKLNPQLVESPTPDAGTPDAKPPQTGPVKRTVELRNPFGSNPENLFVDGDFEMSSALWPGWQFGWGVYSWNGAEVLVLKNETGGLCKNGLRCAVFESGTLMLGRAVAASLGRPMALTFYVRVPDGESCFDVDATLLQCDASIGLPVIGDVPTPAEKEPDGWCKFESSLPPMDSAPCIYLENTLPEGTSAIIDAMTLVPDDGTGGPKPAPRSAVRPETAERAVRLAKFVRDRTLLGAHRKPAGVPAQRSR